MGLLQPRTPPPPRPRAGLEREEERRLARRLRASGDPAALARLVDAHLGLVVRIALEFRRAGPALDDLIQEGNLGLVIAARRFDPRRGTRLSTYATFWIRAFILEHVVRAHGAVRVGTTRAQRRVFWSAGKARRALEREGRVADAAGIAERLGVAEAAATEMLDRLSRRDVSFDGEPGHDDAPLSAHLADPTPDPEAVAAAREEEARAARLVGEALSRLDPRELAILRARHLGDEHVTLSTLGRRLRISRERVRQIESRAKAKIRLALQPRPQASETGEGEG